MIFIFRQAPAARRLCFHTKPDALASAGGSFGPLDRRAVRVTPSPARLRSPEGVRFASVPSGSLVRIYSARGRLVREISSRRGLDVTWDRRTQRGELVVPGVYFYHVVPGGREPLRGRLVLVP